MRIRSTKIVCAMRRKYDVCTCMTKRSCDAEKMLMDSPGTKMGLPVKWDRERTRRIRLHVS